MASQELRLLLKCLISLVLALLGLLRSLPHVAASSKAYFRQYIPWALHFLSQDGTFRLRKGKGHFQPWKASFSFRWINQRQYPTHSWTACWPILWPIPCLTLLFILKAFWLLRAVARIYLPRLSRTLETFYARVQSSPVKRLLLNRSKFYFWTSQYSFSRQKPDSLNECAKIAKVSSLSLAFRH